jgi:N-acetylneuraminic acid mutarotase
MKYKVMNTAMSISLATVLMASVTPVLTWRDRHAMREGRSGGAIGLIENKLIYAGGTTWRSGVKLWLNETLVYDLEHDTWSSGPPLPEPIAYGASLASNGSLEILGGTNDGGPSRKCWRLKAGEHAWSESGILPADSVFAKAVSLRGRLYLFGGSSSATDLSRLSSSVFRRDESGKWTTISQLPQGRVANPAVTAAGDEIYLFGGFSAAASGGALNHRDAYRFDPETNRWTALRPLPAAVRGLSAVAVDRLHILLAGGYTDSGFSAAAYLYDIEDGQYRAATSLPLPVMGMELLARGRTVWGIGGEDKNRSRTARLIEGVFAP